MNEHKKTIVEAEYKESIITKGTIDYIKKHPNYYTRCPIRIQMGNIYTNEEFAKRTDRILGTEMPKGKKNVLQRILKPKRK